MLDTKMSGGGAWSSERSSFPRKNQDTLKGLFFLAGSALGFSGKNWRKFQWSRISGHFSWDCYHRDPALDKLEKMEGWITKTKSHKSFLLDVIMTYWGFCLVSDLLWITESSLTLVLS